MNNDIKYLEPFFGSWHMVELIGEGSFGKVYKIKRETFGKEQYSALKIIQIPQSQAEIQQAYQEGMDEYSATSYFESFVKDITREIELMDSLKGNTNIVAYEDHQIIKKENALGWIILIRMELLTCLNDYMAKTAIAQKDVAELGIDICKALELCRKEKIIHRDIKPENIFISKNGDYKLGDFGIARRLENSASGLSKKGTQTYMAPEVYLGKSYDASVDIYSLGMVMYRLLNYNRAPFTPRHPAPLTFSDKETAQKKLLTGEKMPPPQNADKEIAGIILKACSFNPSDRYKEPELMREALITINNPVNKSPEKSNLKESTEKSIHSAKAGVDTGNILSESTDYSESAKSAENSSGGSCEPGFEDDRTVSIFSSSDKADKKKDKYCAYCGKPVKPTANFCSFCSAQVSKEIKSIYCATCGKPMIKLSKFCGFCGTPVSIESKKIYCATCSKPMSGASKFCAFCGTPVSTEPKPVYCTKCGKPMSRASKFCSVCGTLASSGKKLFCSVCGKQMDYVANNCTNCGAIIKRPR